MTNSDPVAALGELDPRKVGVDEFVQLLEAASELASSGADVDLGVLGPQEFAVLISRASAKQLERVTARPELREPILDEVFRRMGDHYKPDRARSAAVVRWRIGTRDDNVRYECVLSGGGCTVNKPPQHDEARVTITVGAVDFLKLVSGNASAPVLFMKGKLKVVGDLGFAAGLTNLFQIPKA